MPIKNCLSVISTEIYKSGEHPGSISYQSWLTSLQKTGIILLAIHPEPLLKNENKPKMYVHIFGKIGIVES